jgi:hypothetical protein
LCFCAGREPLLKSDKIAFWKITGAALRGCGSEAALFFGVGHLYRYLAETPHETDAAKKLFLSTEETLVIIARNQI